jgi:branched-chain amino acid aminotransferase
MGFPAIWMNGRIVAPADARVSIFDHGLLYGDGVFEGIRFYGGRPFRLDAHLGRLERSAAAIHLPLAHPRDSLRAAIDAVIAEAGAPDGYLRLIATRGEGDLGLDPRSCRDPTTVVAAAPLRAFGGAGGAQFGITAIVASTRQAPPDVIDARIKSLNYLNRLLARIEAVRAGADEAFVLNRQGQLGEGTTDNVFLVRDGILLTPPARDGALEGITRGVVFELANDLGVPLREESLGTYDLHVADEVFVAGTGAELVAVRTIDGRSLRTCPGPIFRRLAEAFEVLVRRETSDPSRGSPSASAGS